MKEFGSNFHYLPVEVNAVRTIGHYHPGAVYYATGRHAMIDLYRQMGWKRLWVPEYFCYEVLGSVLREGVNVAFYTDYPTFDEDDVVRDLPFEEGDALFRVNYFGLRSMRSNRAIKVPVVEDHTHDLIGPWACSSDADWCIASLRKTLPLAEGGMLWSPQGHRLKNEPAESSHNKEVAAIMWNAMRQKALYMENKITDKTEFRNAMIAVEEALDSMEVSALDPETADYLEQFDVNRWYKGKRENWSLLNKVAASDAFKILEPETTGCNPFSMTILFSDKEARNRFRKALIDNDVYPAILWNIPDEKTPIVKDFSQQMLSIHCDTRYNKDDIMDLYGIINQSNSYCHD